jgi:transposase
MNGNDTIKRVIKFLCMFMPETLAKRLVCIILISVGVPTDQISQLTGFCSKTVKSVQKRLREGDISGLFKIGGGGRKSKTADVEKAIIDEINTNQYHSRQQIADMIFEKHGIKVSVNAVGELLKKSGIKKLKCGSIPSKADPVKQRTFFEEVLQPLMKQAQNNNIALLFADASHFVMGCDFLGYVYGKVRHFVRTSSGRKRYNILGALNFVTKKITTITNDTYITATQVCDLLRKVADEYVGIPIFLVLDNASYQKCRVVFELAGELGINLVHLPSYSPNLNLIERLWKFVKAELRSQYYDDFGIFKGKINAIIDSTDKKNKQAIDRLISEKVQLFDALLPVEKNPCICTSKPQQQAA